MAEANRVLVDFLLRFNAQCAVPPARPGSAYGTLPEGLDLDGVLCFKYQRTVARDNTVRFGRHTIQLLPGLDRQSYAQARVEVQERLDGTMAVCYQGQVISSTEAPPNPVTLRARKGTRVPSSPQDRLVVGVRPVVAHHNGDQGSGAPGLGPDHEGARPQAGNNSIPWKPGPNHPWRRPLVTKSLNY